MKSQVQEAGQPRAQSNVISTVSTGGYKVDGKINNISTFFLMDTGSTVTLIRKDTWEWVHGSGERELAP